MATRHSKSLIYDIYGAYLRSLGGWVAIADLITLLGHLGVDEQAVRSSVSRMSRKGMLVRRRLEGQVGYQLSAEAESMLEEGDLAIFSGMKPAKLEDGWVLVTFSVPENERGTRHRLRSQLTWLGYGILGSGIWIAPRRVMPRTVEVIRRLGLEAYVDIFAAEYEAFRPLPAMVARCWDLEGLAGMYEEFVAEHQSTLRHWKRRGDKPDDLRAFVDYTTVLHDWRKMPFLDPGLPLDLLPRNWRGHTAAHLFNDIVERLEKPALRYVESVIRRS